MRMSCSQHYNLDVILSVGYRVSSPKATRFRQWATQTLRSYIVDGYAINESRLRTDAGAANRLAAKLREIRADEKNIYASVREYFKIASTDYDNNSAKCKTFCAMLQDKFHWTKPLRGIGVVRIVIVIVSERVG